MLPDVCRENLLAIVAAYAQSTGLSRDQISRRFYGNRVFLEEFERGECSVTVQKLWDFMVAIRRSWPKDVPWPRTRPMSMRRPPVQKSQNSPVKESGRR